MATTTHAIEDVDKGPQLVAVVLVLLFLSTIPVVLRIYARLSTRPRTYGIDDTFLIASWVCAFYPHGSGGMSADDPD